ncbi:MAG: hypothetical protein IKQ23_06320 [Treponema sp.]|nr:hypothetical protein [Treponema sp.]MBR7080712.1 hypothetical protein [Treponema sp.]
MNDVMELEHDFKNALEDVDFTAYSPYSREYMKALFIGQMWDLVKKLHEEKGTSMYEDIEEELDGAKKYYDTYKKTGDVQFKDMASDELRHAGVLIKKHTAKAATKEEKDTLNALEVERTKWVSTMSA